MVKNKFIQVYWTEMVPQRAVIIEGLYFALNGSATFKRHTSLSGLEP